MYKLNLNNLNRINLNFKPLVDEEIKVLCKIKWFNQNKGFGFLLQATREDIQNYLDALLALNKSDDSNTQPQANDIQLQTNDIQCQINDLTPLLGAQNEKEIGDRDIFCHSSKLDWLKVGGGIANNLFSCMVVFSERGPQVQDITAYYIPPRDTNQKICNGVIKFYKTEAGYGFIKPDTNNDSLKSDIFFPERTFQMYGSILNDTQYGTQRVRCYYSFDDRGQPVANKIELI